MFKLESLESVFFVVPFRFIPSMLCLNIEFFFIHFKYFVQTLKGLSVVLIYRERERDESNAKPKKKEGIFPLLASTSFMFVHLYGISV